MEAVIFTVIVGFLILRRCLKDNKEKDGIKFNKEKQGGNN